MTTIRHAAWTLLSGLLLTAGARAGDPPASDAATAVELRQAFERSIAADVDLEWAAVAKRAADGVQPACAATGVCELSCDCAPAAELLAYRLIKDAAAWEVVTPLFEARLADAATRARALDLLAWAGGAGPARALAERAYAADAAALSSDQLIALAQAGSAPLWRAVEERAARDVRCAAVVGGATHARRLAAAAAAPIRADAGGAGLIDAYVAASALRRDGHSEHWSRLQERVHDEVLRALDDGAIERARDLALGAEFCAKTLSRPAGSGLAYLDSRLAYHRSLRAGAAVEPDQVFDLIEHAATL